MGGVMGARTQNGHKRTEPWTTCADSGSGSELSEPNSKSCTDNTLFSIGLQPRGGLKSTREGVADSISESLTSHPLSIR